MKLPFISREDHEALMEAMKANCEARSQTISALAEVIADKDRQISALTEILTNKKCNDYTPADDKKGKREVISTPGRLGWRTHAELASDRTIPAPKDSAQALQQRVEEQGGK